MRTTREVKYLRYDFDNAEKMAMGNSLATNYNRLADLKAEEAVFKAQMKDKLAGIELSIQGLSRALYTGYEMRNIDCAVRWDSPNVNEVEYIRTDTGEVAIVRPMTEQERQQELEFTHAVEDAAATKDASVENIETFFGKPRLAPEPEFELVQESPDEEPETDEEDEDDAIVDELEVFSDPTPDANLEAIKPEHDEAWEATKGFDAPEKKGRGRPKGSTKKVEEDEAF